LTVSPNDVEALGTLSEHYLQVGNYPRAVELLQRAAEVTPQDSSIRNRLGAALLMDRQYEPARQSFSSVLELSSGGFDALEGIGLSYFLEGNFVQAAGTFRKSLESPTNLSAEPALLAYAALKRSGNAAEADALLAKEIAEFNGRPAEHLLLLFYAGRVDSFPYEISDQPADKSRAYLLAAEGSIAHGGSPTRELWECILAGGKDSLYATIAKRELEKLSSPPSGKHE